MKKSLKVLLAAFLAGATALSASSCDTVKRGSVIKNCTVTIGYNADGVYKEQDVTIELYMNFAPTTIEHFSYLVEKGYYNDTVVSNLEGYFEFGAFSKNNGEYVSKYNDGANGYYGIITDDYANGKTLIGDSSTMRYYAKKGMGIYGEFLENGVGGNKLDFYGSLVLKRDYSEHASKSYYNTGKATMALTFSTSDYFDDKGKYAILGRLSREDEITIKDDNGNDTTVTSNDFVFKLMNKFKTQKDDGETYSNTYHYFSYDYSEYPYEEGD
ncbi:MAG: peptidylprolyl isomerase, partial [Clostridia bacterium]|nr:peptidylprolyl isomerase [Clostridia bacterium]